MQVRPKTTFTIEASEEDFKLITMCIAQCAGLKGIRVDPKDAQDLNLRMVAQEVAHRNEQAKLAEAKYVKASQGLPEPEAR